MNSRLPTWKSEEQSSRVLGLNPLFSAPVVMIGFHVEPGANWPWVARNSSGLSAFAE